MASCLVLVVLLIRVCGLTAVSQQPHTLDLLHGQPKPGPCRSPPWISGLWLNLGVR